MRACAFCVVLLIAVAGCGGDEDGGSGGGANASSSGGAPSGSGGVGPEAAKPAKRPALTEADFTKLSSRTLAGFSAAVSRVSERQLLMTFTSDEKTPGGVKIIVHARIQPCDAMACYSMDPTDKMNEQWAKQAREMLVKQGYEDGVFDVGTFELAAGYGGFMYFQLAHKIVEREGGLQSKTGVHGFNVRYHDGSNAIQLQVYKRGSFDADSTADLERAMPRAMAEEAARKVFGLYADLFEKGGR